MKKADYQEPLNYGFNQIIKEYAGFPWHLPLPANLEHGWTNRNHPLQTDLNSGKPLMLVFSRRRKAQWKEKSKIPVEVVGAPFIHYKNMRKLKKKDSARGTVIFPLHSTFDLKAEYNIDEFCKELKNLPKKFQPVTICLFYIDYISPLKKKYQSYGFKIATAGSGFAGSMSFVKNFYKILSDHRYAASNEVGSAGFYAADFGLPFFLIGQKPQFDISKTKDVNIAFCPPGVDAKPGELARKMFSTGPVCRISKKQRGFVREEMGLDDCLSRNQLKNLFEKYTTSGFTATVKYLIWKGSKKIIFDAPWTPVLVKIKYKISNK